MLSLVSSCCGWGSTTAKVISDRGLAVLEGGDSAYYLGWKEYERNPYHPVSNPQGCIQLGLAESTLSLDLIQEWMRLHPEALQVELKEMAGYQNYAGVSTLRNALSSFMEDLFKARLEPESIVVTSGATAAIEILSFCLAEPGDAFLVPAPYYPGFSRDCKWKSNVELVPVPCYSTDNFNITAGSLNSSLSQARKNGKRVRGLLISSPSNPVGNTLQAETLSMILEFIKENSIHLICDEIYAGSTFTHPEFVSIAKVVEDLGGSVVDKESVHIVYGLSKDLGLAGFRVGLLHSWNKQVVLAAGRLARFCAVSSQTQQLVAALLSDRAFVREYLEENRKRLKQRYSWIRDLLKSKGVSCVQGNAGFYCWIDLRKCVKAGSETETWEKLVYELGVNLTPGSACCCSEPGWFRLCFANQHEATLSVAIERFKEL